MKSIAYWAIKPCFISGHKGKSTSVHFVEFINKKNGFEIVLIFLENNDIPEG